MRVIPLSSHNSRQFSYKRHQGQEQIEHIFDDRHEKTMLYEGLQERV
jgi:hypothetical protein